MLSQLYPGPQPSYSFSLAWYQCRLVSELCWENSRWNSDGWPDNIVVMRALAAGDLVTLFAIGGNYRRRSIMIWWWCVRSSLSPFDIMYLAAHVPVNGQLLECQGFAVLITHILHGLHAAPRRVKKVNRAIKDPTLFTKYYPPCMSSTSYSLRFWPVHGAIVTCCSEHWHDPSQADHSTLDIHAIKRIIFTVQASARTVRFHCLNSSERSIFAPLPRFILYSAGDNPLLPPFPRGHPGDKIMLISGIDTKYWKAHSFPYLWFI